MTYFDTSVLVAVLLQSHPKNNFQHVAPDLEIIVP
jgi:hypothetical protein